MVPGYRGFHWCVRPLYTWELKEMHCSSRKLLPSGGHSWEARHGREAPGGTQPDKGISVQAEQEAAQPRGGLSLSPSHWLSGRSKNEREGSCHSLDGHVRWRTRRSGQEPGSSCHPSFALARVSLRWLPLTLLPPACPWLQLQHLQPQHLMP